ncbi:hypothetical protein M2444_005345 [Paenibacillus sp. PastF-3]|nr:hypothetical protein [Paenibacillus sp. PastF-3]
MANNKINRTKNYLNRSVDKPSARIKGSFVPIPRSTSSVPVRRVVKGVSSAEN